MNFKNNMLNKENIFNDNDLALEMYQTAVFLLQKNDRSASFYKKLSDFYQKLEQYKRQKLITCQQYSVLFKMI